MFCSGNRKFTLLLKSKIHSALQKPLPSQISAAVDW